MLKKLGIPTMALAALMSVVPAHAAVRFGVGIGGPVYAPAYPYAYYPNAYYAPAYPYVYPYVYGGWGWGWHGGHYYRHWR